MIKFSRKKVYFILGILGIFFGLFFFNPRGISDIIIQKVVNIKDDLFYKENFNKIGWITDIHAGANKKRAFVNEDGSDNTLYPKKYKEYFPMVLDKMKKEGIRTVIVTGDSTNITEFKYAKDLKKIADEKDLNVVWVRGNHDFLTNKDTMIEFGVTDYFYSYDTKTARIIVLDINFNGPLLSKENINWLKEKLAETNLPVIISMHTPIIDYDSGNFQEAYTELGNIITSSGKVKFVISGHTHKDREIKKDGIIFRTAWPLTQKYHTGSYYTININEGSVDHAENYYEEK